VRDARRRDLTDVECRKLLAERYLGRLALTDPAGPAMFPVNYAFDEGAVVFRTDPGSKLDTMAGGARSRLRSTRSMRVAGPAGAWSSGARRPRVSKPADLDRLHRLPPYPWAPAAKARYIRIRAVSITGQRIAMPANLPLTWWS
jgi:hypothetical protein